MFLKKLCCNVDQQPIAPQFCILLFPSNVGEGQMHNIFPYLFMHFENSPKNYTLSIALFRKLTQFLQSRVDQKEYKKLNLLILCLLPADVREGQRRKMFSTFFDSFRKCTKKYKFRNLTRTQQVHPYTKS